MMKAKCLILAAAVVVVLLLSDHVSAALIAHYPFDDGSGTVATDVVAGNNGTIKDWNDVPGGPKGSWVAGQIGGAYDFNGTDSSDTPLAALNGLDQAGANPSHVTVAYWAKNNNVLNLSDSGFSPQFHFQVGTMWIESWLAYNQFVGQTINHNIHTGSGFSDQIFIQPAVGDAAWHHYALVKDQTAGTLKLYVDGVVGATVAATALFAAPGKFDIGSAIFGGSRFDGSIDDFRIYNTPLSGTQIQSLIPEPGTMTLISVGSLLALLRRKR